MNALFMPLAAILNKSFVICYLAADAAAATTTTTPEVEDIISISTSSPTTPPSYAVDDDDDGGVASQPTQGLIFLRCKLIETKTSQFTIIWLITCLLTYCCRSSTCIALSFDN